MALFRTTEELRKYIPVNLSFSLENVMAFVEEAERDFLYPVVSQEQYEILDAAHNAETDPSPEQAKLIALIQKAVGNFALLLYMPLAQIQISDSGVHISSTEEKKTAFQWQIKDAQKTFMHSGFAAIEPIYEYLELKKDIFTAWAESSAYSIFKESFVNTAKEFSNHVGMMKNSRRMFLALKPAISKVENFHIKPLLGDLLFAKIKTEILSGTITDESKMLLNYIKPAVCHFAFANAITDNVVVADEKGITVYNTNAVHSVDAVQPAHANQLSNLQCNNESDAKAYLGLLFNYLQKFSANYPLYTPPSQGQEFDNSTSSIFVL